MIAGSESGSARRGFGSPSLFASDLQGQALWMGSRVRATLGEEAGGLLHVQSRFVQHYFRLQSAERGLAHLTQASRPAAGASAVRQVERERERLGRDLHTGVGQLLVAIKLQLEVVEALLPNPPAAVRTALKRIAGLASDAGEQVRSLSRQLHPPEWQRLSLETALRQLWENSGIPERFEARLQIDALPREPQQEVKVLVYRAAQEALSNLVRHSQASRVNLSLRAGDNRVILGIEDNGVGFEVARMWSAPANVAQGIGLRSIREQAASLGGSLEVSSGAAGTRLELAVPFEWEQA